jgi:dTDP-glucose 4,6-dehydratase
VEYVSDRPGHDFRYAIDTKEIAKELGWKPKFNFEQGMKKTFEYYEKKIYEKKL